MSKTRNSIWAALLSLITPGLGHVYAGSLRKGLLIIGFQFAVILLAGVLGILSTFYGIVLFIGLTVGFYVYVISSSVRLAIVNMDYQLRPYNHWYWYLAIFVLFYVLSNALFSSRGDILGYESYKIPAKSMDPTLQVGDFITVDTAYQQPKVGDVIVFLYPKDRSIPYVKRVAAIGNDMISIENGIVTRNGKPEPLLFVPNNRRLKDYSISMGERQVPENEIFVLGDWRDNSSDSRLWGTVPLSDLIGQVTYIWYAKDSSRIGQAVE